MNKWKLLGIGLIANIVENLTLLSFFKVELDRQMVIGSSVFALITILLFKLIEEK